MGRRIPEDNMYDIIQPVGIISQLPNGDAKSVNIMSWHGNHPTMDIRAWSEHGDKPRSGITLNETEMNKFISAYLRDMNNGIEIPKEPVRNGGSFVVHKCLEVLSGFHKEFRKEFTVTSLMGKPAAFDLRGWKKDHVTPGKGISLTEDEAKKLVQMLIWYRDGAKTPRLTTTLDLPLEKGERRRISCIFRVGNVEVETIGCIKDKKPRPVVDTFVKSYAGHTDADEFVPDEIRKEVLRMTEASLLKGETTLPEAEPVTVTGKFVELVPVLPIRTASSEMLEAKAFPERLRACRTQANIAQTKLAELAGLGKTTPYFWESRGPVVPNINQNVEAAAKVLGVSAEWLATGKGDVFGKKPSKLRPKPAPVMTNKAPKTSNKGLSVADKILSHEPKTFGERVLACRKTNELSRTELAECIGVSMNSVWIWETKPSNITPENLTKLAELFQVYEKWLRSGVRPVNASDEERLNKEAIKKREVLLDSTPVQVKAREEEKAPAKIAAAKIEKPVRTKTVSGDEKAKNDLALINACIGKLSGDSSDANLEMYRRLAEIRNELESKVLFGETAEKSGSVEAEIRQISETILLLRDTSFSDSDRDAIYVLLSEKRFDLEVGCIRKL